MGTPTYRVRLRIEGFTLAFFGAAVAVTLLLATPQAARGPLNTLVQLAVVAALMTTLGPRSVRTALQASTPIRPGETGSGEPTPLWQLPLIVVGLTVAVGAPGGWDAGLRVAAGCVVVGLAQALLLERIVSADERRRGATHYRLKGSRILRGTRLGHVPARLPAR